MTLLSDYIMLTGTGPEAVITPKRGFTVWRDERTKVATRTDTDWTFHSIPGNLKTKIRCKTKI